MPETIRINVYGRRGTRVVYVPRSKPTPQNSPFLKPQGDGIENAISVSPVSVKKVGIRPRKVNGHSTSPRGSPKSGKLLQFVVKMKAGPQNAETPNRKPLGLKNVSVAASPSIVFLGTLPPPTPNPKASTFEPFVDSKIVAIPDNDTIKKGPSKKATKGRMKFAPITNISAGSVEEQVRPAKRRAPQRPIVVSESEDDANPVAPRRVLRGNKTNPIIVSDDSDSSDSDYVEPAVSIASRRQTIAPKATASQKKQTRGRKSPDNMDGESVPLMPNSERGTSQTMKRSSSQRPSLDSPRSLSTSQRKLDLSFLRAGPLTPLSEQERSLRHHQGQVLDTSIQQDDDDASIAELETSFEALSISVDSLLSSSSTKPPAKLPSTKAKVLNRPKSLPPKHLKPLLKECQQVTPLDFTSFVETFPFHELDGSISASSPSFRKIGEASFSEVYAVGNVVLKVIPLRDESGASVLQDPDDEELPQESDAKDVLQEIVVTRAMGRLCPGFIRLLRTFIVAGEYPAKLLDLWDDFSDKKKSENIRPDVFPHNQAYALLALPNGGPDLEAYTFPIKTGWRQACSIFWQTAKALAVAEDLVSFEHRDLHWGQILVKTSPVVSKSSKGTRLRGVAAAAGMMSGVGEFGQLTMDHPSHGVAATIIDLGLARMDGSEGSSEVHWTPVDELIFEGEGDYQFDIYRLMRLAHHAGDWSAFRPITNVMWLHYLTTKLIRSKRLRSPSSRNGMLLSIDFGEKQAYDCLVETEHLLEKSISQVRTKKGRSATKKGLFGNAGDVVSFARDRGWVE